MKRKLGVYIHIPFCNGKCAYCDFTSGVYSDEIKQAYFKSLISEIMNFDFSEYVVDTVYFGGGTPSSVSASYITEIVYALKAQVELDINCEFSIECNPESVTEEKLYTYKKIGINRISLGLQTTNNEILKSIGRLHDLKDFISAIDLTNKYFDNVSADLMLGLPLQNASDVTNAIKLLAEKSVKHVSAYGLKVEEGTSLAKSGFTPDEDFTSYLYDLTVNELAKLGYTRYEVSNFAMPGYECKHNKRYWNRSEYFGFGVSAQSFVKYARIENTSDLSEYIKGKTVAQKYFILSNSPEAKVEMIMLALRTSDGLDLTEFYENFGIDLIKDKSSTISALSDFLIVDNTKLKLSNKGYYVMNEIILRLID